MKHRRSSLSLSVVLVGALVLAGSSKAVKPSSSSRGRSCFPKPAGIHKRILSSNFADVHLQLDVQARLSTLLSLRGGEVLDEEDEDGDDALVGSVRTVIKAVLGISGPVLGAPVKLFVMLLEGLLGVKLLPQPKLKRKVTKRSGSSSSMGSTKTPATATSKRKKKKRKTSVEASEPKVQTKPPPSEKRKAPAKKKKTGSLSDAAMMHLKTKLSPTNPNYRIQRELRIFVEDPPDGLRVRVGKNIRVWIVDMKGVGIYKSEKFQLRVKFPSNYPTMPPSVYFLPPHIPTHEHVYTNGDICLSLLGKDWRPTMSAQSIVLSIQSILGSAQSKSLPMDNVKQAQNKPGEYQKDWVYHDDLC